MSEEMSEEMSKSAESSQQSATEPSATDLMHPEVAQMIHGEGYKPKPLPSWRKCPLIQASRLAEFRPIPNHTTPKILQLPEHIRATLNGCKVFQPQQIAEYNRILEWDGKLVSGVDHMVARNPVKPGRLYHKFDSLCALATSRAGRLLVIQHRELNHVFYAICYDPAHKPYIDWLNMYERRWYALSVSYGK
ncbi:uncharacterized protein [Physcomitrium patens]|uniref:Uncharacterized protein n=1 Tax=Physcomitrium patens TaxID=3218 RepID=A0A2K1IH12_PHYPA|nr:uncharacterized protein LOC112276875 [Physcomitrium patens]PNR28561.1 hypothetical protein PHYPA_029153 [Physcomitrium patens]|eukprot:XP_024364425.1 uncharacterized protein LOC112276875 [Physcomitrella patens]